MLIAQNILDNYQLYDDFMVLHGTDTMAWTPSALSFMLPNLSKSVTVTGSQLPLFVEDSKSRSGYQLLFNTDALRNVLGAIRFFSMEVPEVCLYFADNLFRGNRVVRSNASQYALPVPKSKFLSLPKNIMAAKAALRTMKKTCRKIMYCRYKLSSVIVATICPFRCFLRF